MFTARTRTTGNMHMIHPSGNEFWYGHAMEYDTAVQKEEFGYAQHRQSSHTEY